MTQVGGDVESMHKEFLKTLATLDKASDISIESLPSYLKKKTVMLD